MIIIIISSINNYVLQLYEWLLHEVIDVVAA